MRVFVADDHPIVLRGLRTLIEAEPDMEVVGDAPDGLAALEAIQRLAPDVAVIDLAMPNLAGPETTERIRASCPDVKVLALTAHEERGFVQMALVAGAAGFVLKRAAANDVVHAIRAVAGGGVYLDPAMAAQIMTSARKSNGTPAVAIAELSERESQVLRLIAEGHPMKEIATQLAVSTRTLETYRMRAMEKLGLDTRADIVRYALRRGWLKSG